MQISMLLSYAVFCIKSHRLKTEVLDKAPGSRGYQEMLFPDSKSRNASLPQVKGRGNSLNHIAKFALLFSSATSCYDVLHRGTVFEHIYSSMKFKNFLGCFLRMSTLESKHPGLTILLLVILSILL